MSKIEVNQISSQCGSTLTIGQSGDTVTLAAGATQTGFGRTGTVDWDTTAKTASFTAVSGNGYFVNTTSGAITMTLPATPSAGDIVSFKDYAGTFATNNLTIGRNGSNLDGNAGDRVINTNHTSMSLVYVDATQGWKSVEEGTGYIGENFVVATGGTETICGDYKIHTFTGPGTFTVSSIATSPTNNLVDYLVVAGGGGGAKGCRVGGGGAGGYRESSGAASGCYTASPLGACVSALPISATDYPITVGAGGAIGATSFSPGSNGANSIFSTITSAGGGGGGGGPNTGSPTDGNGLNGGSGGGGAHYIRCGGTGNSPPVSPPQGQNGGNGVAAVNAGSGGGGGAGAVGGNASGCVPGTGGVGGNGVATSITGSSVTRAGGGGGGGDSGSQPGGTGGGGASGNPGIAGTANTGGGGGGTIDGSDSREGGAGGSGIVIIRYKYQ
jgi:hypothetical protein